MDEQTFQSLLDTALDALDSKNSHLQATFGLGSLGRFWFDQSTQKVQFFDKDDTLAVEADAIVIGSYAPESKSWRWAWANDSNLPEVRERSEGLRDLAGITGFDLFAREHAFEIDDEDMAWEFLALAVHHLEACGGYRIPSPNRPLFTYLALKKVIKPA